MKMSVLRHVAICVAMSVVGPSAFGQLIIAHRGASHDAPENTLAAFRLAMEQRADGFEADFYLTADGHVVCFHDKDTERLCGKKLLVSRTPFDELRALDVGSWKGPRWKDERMPTLEEVLDAVPAGKKIFIELKSGPEIVEPMAKVIEASSLSSEQIVVISFHADAIEKCKERLPDLRAHWLTGYKEQPDGRLAPTKEAVAATIRRSGADGFGSQANPDHFDAAFATHLRDSGCREFHVWTVNEPDVARYYQKLGAWSITTDRPGWLREQLGDLESP
jgi:glycerophosphoryl diester phosphodiesterase